MNKIIKLSTLLLVTFTAIACERGFSITSNQSSNNSSINNDLSSNNDSSISQDQSSSPSEQTSIPEEIPFHSIDESWVDEDVFATPVNYELNATLSLDEANNLVNNDFANNYNQTNRTKFTTIERTKIVSHTLDNRSTSTYSINYRTEEKCSVRKVDSVNKWCYQRTSEDSINDYFVEDDLVRHIVLEQLYFVRDNKFYYVRAESSYYEGQEDRGKFESYYQIIPDMSQEEIDSYFSLNPLTWSYFGNAGLSRIENKTGDNFIRSSSYYTIEDYDIVEHQTNCGFASKGNGYFDCLLTDSASYYFDNLRDYPSTERTVLNSIDYNQKYLLNISNYSSYTENYITNSVSKTRKGETLREATRQGKKIVKEECEIFYPDLSKFEEREYTPPIHK